MTTSESLPLANAPTEPVDPIDPIESGSLVPPTPAVEGEPHAVETPPRPAPETGAVRAPGFLPTGPARLGVESVFVRFIATAGVIGVGTALGAVLAANEVAGWTLGLVVSIVSVVLAAILWRSRRL